jgi:hypothetical protein
MIVTRPPSWAGLAQYTCPWLTCSWPTDVTGSTAREMLTSTNKWGSCRSASSGLQSVAHSHKAGGAGGANGHPFRPATPGAAVTSTTAATANTHALHMLSLITGARRPVTGGATAAQWAPHSHRLSDARPGLATALEAPGIDRYKRPNSRSSADRSRFTRRHPADGPAHTGTVGRPPAACRAQPVREDRQRMTRRRMAPPTIMPTAPHGGQSPFGAAAQPGPTRRQFSTSMPQPRGPWGSTR